LGRGHGKRLSELSSSRRGEGGQEKFMPLAHFNDRWYLTVLCEGVYLEKDSKGGKIGIYAGRRVGSSKEAERETGSGKNLLDFRKTHSNW